MPLPMHQKEAVKNIIGIAAGKGGVGKSTVTVNLALALQQKGYAVGVLDMDLYGPSIRKMLPEDSLPQEKEGVLTPALSRGIKVMTFAYFRPAGEANAVRAPIANGIAGQFIEQVAWGNLDYLLIDFPPGTGDIQLTICQKARLTGAIMVTTPQEVALLDVRKAMHLFDQVKVPILGVVENMSYFSHQGEKHFLFGQGGGEKLSRESGVPFLGEIPIDPRISRSGDEGSSLFVEENDSSRAFHAVADRLETGEDKLLAIKQKDNHTLSIEWSDGSSTDYNLHQLQKQCPCAGCADAPSRNLDPAVQAVKISYVGRYALRIQFSSGCSAGIYDFETLRGLHV